VKIRRSCPFLLLPRDTAINCDETDMLTFV